MLPAIRQDLTLAQGDTLAINATVAEDVNNNPVVSAAGWTLVVVVKVNLTDADSAAVLTAAAGASTVAGNVVQQLLATGGLTPGARLVYAARLIDPFGHVFSYQYGNLFVASPVSQNPQNLMPASYMPSFTSIATLVALPTAGYPAGLCLDGTINGAKVTVELQAGNNATGGGYFKPADNATSNLVWVQI